MKKQFLTKALVLSLLFSPALTLADTQNMCIKSQKIIGGSGEDDDGSNGGMISVPGGYISCGETNSTDGDFHVAAGRGFDAFIVKQNNAGNIVWSYTYGGSGEDNFYSLTNTADGGFIAIGKTTSDDGEVSGNHGGNDVWLVKFNKDGIIQWQKCYGGSGDDIGIFLTEANSDNDYIFCGNTTSVNGDVTNNHGDFDAWIVKISFHGNIIWQKTYGGSDYDDASGIEVKQPQMELNQEKIIEDEIPLPPSDE